MISSIYAVRNRGQVVTASCQWIWEHKLLAFKLILIPMLIVEIALMLNMLILDNTIIYLLIGIFLFLVVPVMSNFMFYVVENPDEFGYPYHTHGLMRVYGYWWHYFWPLLKISFLTGIFEMLTSFTVIVPMVLPFIQWMAIVITQREDDKNVVDTLLDAFKMICNSLGTAVMCFFSSLIIVACMAGVPALMVKFIDYCMVTFMSHELYRMIMSVFSNDTFNIYILVVGFGCCLSLQIVMVILHFFYGHCKEYKDHPALIERMEQFS